MLQQILVPLDGSALGERALPYAVQLAKAAKARLTLLRVMSVLDVRRSGHTELDQQAGLSQIAERLRAEGVEVAPRICFVGYEEVGPAIGDIARQQQADLIVMSTHGHGGVRRAVYGSVADEVMRRSLAPVLLVPAACTRDWTGDAAPRIVVPLDGSALSERAIEPAQSLARAMGAELLLVRVVPPANYTALTDAAVFPPVDVDAEQGVADRYLEQIGLRLRLEGTVVTTRVVVGEPVGEIAKLAKGQNAALIAMATHGRGGLARFVFGSVAAGTLQAATLPLLLVRAATGTMPERSPFRAEPIALDLPETTAVTVPTEDALKPEDWAVIRTALARFVERGERDAASLSRARNLLATLDAHPLPANGHAGDHQPATATATTAQAAPAATNGEAKER